MSNESQSSASAQAWPRSRCSSSWRPMELVAVILGFIVFWPLGLAILFLKLWQMNSGHGGSLTTFTQEKADWARNAAQDMRPRQWACRTARWGQSASTWSAANWSAASPTQRTNNGWNPRSTGNAAFDEWRAGELARLEEERRKVEAAERDFSEHIDELRRARDREEFERFMNARRNGQTPTSTQ